MTDKRVTNAICLIMPSNISMAVALRSMGTTIFWIFPHLYEKMAEREGRLELADFYPLEKLTTPQV